MTDLGVAVVVEDDEDVRNLIEAVLSQAGFDVHLAARGREGVDVVRRLDADVVTLDVGLPDIDGFEVLRRIRLFSDAYVVMLTARTDEMDTLTALHTGADDFLTKPFRPRELRARVAAMMRRPRQNTISAPLGTAVAAGFAAPAVPQDSMLRHNGLELNPDSRTVTVDGAATSLTRSEFDLLHALLKGAGAVRSKSDLVRVVRGEYYAADAYIGESDERAVEVHIGNLRRKLREDPLQPRWLQTIRGVGYRLAPQRG
ncbi:response regulator transcription factor [Arthrobacter sp. AL08]|uniref:response regulator transcription factor n=1 Tax=unclassified Arthrobacter TaxID=235627 RepID=UPI00249CED0F|nr:MULTISPECIES: response regulator transcription factor [unclassified Arthrobacter]MDI3241429.1 response regulator transcription factor [Arthrobacter sp. AL05]MDI3277314.1 response regulator transcription factor [Arthrobacter sp. AL08]